MRQSKAKAAARMEAERRAAAEAARVSAERRAAAEEDCITADVARLHHIGKPPWRRRRGFKWRGDMPHQRQSALNHRGGEKGQLVQFVRK